MHNTIQELLDAHHTARVRHISLSPAGCRVFRKLSLAALPQVAEYTMILRKVRGNIFAVPLPLNIDPELHQCRRQARSESIWGQYGSQAGVVHTNAARHPCGDLITALVAHRNGRLIEGTAITAGRMVEAEETAIAMAKHADANTIISDSKQAIGNFVPGRIFQQAYHVLTHLSSKKTFVWTRAHATLAGNDSACSLSPDLAR